MLIKLIFRTGFTFSFPMYQKNVNSAILISWTKSYNCSGVVGEDVVRLLDEAIKRNTDLNITVNSVLNDTTGQWWSPANVCSWDTLGH